MLDFREGKNMKCPKCKTGELKYYEDNYYVGCTKCDFRNGFLKFIEKVRGRLIKSNNQMNSDKKSVATEDD